MLDKKVEVKMKLIAMYVVSFLICVAVSALGYWLGGHSFAERGKELVEWYAVTMMLSSSLPLLLVIIIKVTE